MVTLTIHQAIILLVLLYGIYSLPLILAFVELTPLTVIFIRISLLMAQVKVINIYRHPLVVTIAVYQELICFHYLLTMSFDVKVTVGNALYYNNRATFVWVLG